MKNLYQFATTPEKLFLYAGPEHPEGETNKTPTIDLKALQTKNSLSETDIDNALQKTNDNIKDAHTTLADQYNLQKNALSMGIKVSPENQITQNPDGSYAFNGMTISADKIQGSNVYYSTQNHEMGSLIGRLPGKGGLQKLDSNFPDIISGAMDLENILTEQKNTLSTIGADITEQVNRSNNRDLASAEAMSRAEEGNYDNILNDLP